MRLGPIASVLILGLMSTPATAQPPMVPPTDVEATRPPTPPRPPETPPELPPVLAPEPTSGLLDPRSRFDYQGSPLGSFAPYPSTSLAGAPTDPFDSPRSFTTLDAARIQQRMPGATPELLQMLPGVLIQRTNQGGGSLIIRGRNGNQNLIMVDGIPINDAGWRFANVQYLNYIDPGVIERIEVIRGPASVLYGSGAVGGVLGLALLNHYLYWTMDFYVPQTLDVLTMLGFVILIGTVVNNPILIVHQSLNYMRDDGMSST
ncbi:MAG TPA: TonB-dependent receptor plug domain-containing protein, partial [Gemmatales bacterium]|nr:TonB-dependent receptor plug domain-containing protein [Gemmatales bacterium]